MSDTIIKVEGLGKRYFIGHEKTEHYTTMRDVITNGVKAFGNNITRLFNNETASIAGSEIESFWALSDLDFEIKQGDAVGIIGRNGAGKSTLLKVLSRISEPTKGRIEIRGRMASLLEVGTGFHPELSGRENIYLNGAILGMTRAEIKRKFDEIVDFSGVEKFLDTPVKRYSSGMYVRLAFAVAAHLESEILIVDEVLAVGDAEFQKKCLDKMGEVTSGQGRTVLFVSHNMAAIEKLCNIGLLLNNGTIHSIADSRTIVANYLEINTSSTTKNNDISSYTQRSGSGILKFSRIELIDESSRAVLSEIQSGSNIRFRIYFDTKEEYLNNVLLGIGINDHFDQRIAFLSNEMINHSIEISLSNTHFLDLSINKLPLAPGKYNLNVFFSVKGEVSDWIKNCFHFNVISGDFYNTGRELPNEQGNFLIHYSIEN